MTPATTRRMHETFFEYLSRYRPLIDADKAIFRKYAVSRQVLEGEILLEQGQYAREFYFICDGILKIVITNTKGDSVTQFFVKENHFCTILYSFNNNTPADEAIIAACPTQLLVFTKGALEHIYAELPWFKQLFEDISRQTLLEKIKARSQYLGEDATTRYRKFLENQPDIVLRVSLSDVASYLEITPQSLSRIRKGLK